MRRPLLFSLLVSLLLGGSASWARELTAVTYNLGLLRVLGSDYVPAVEERAARAPEALERFAREAPPDILLLQEVWRDRDVRAIESALALLGYSFVRPAARSIIGLTSGLLLAVKAPLHVSDWRFRRFRRSAGAEVLSSKGVLQATLETPEEGGLRLALVGTHTVALDTDNGIPTVSAQLRAFSAQAEDILRAADERSRHGELPLLILGDLNVGPSYADEAYRLIAAAEGITDVGDELHPGDPLVTWDPANPLVRYGEYPNEPPAAIDHILYRDGTTQGWRALEAGRVFDAPAPGLAVTFAGAAGALPTPLSDHYGLMTRLELTAR